jgi:hypothetical protein
VWLNQTVFNYGSTGIKPTSELAGFPIEPDGSIRFLKHLRKQLMNAELNTLKPY